jgi:hypothetical protein
MSRPFIDRIKPAPKMAAFRMDGYWVWCGSPIRGEDGRYHLFASRWAKTFSFRNWATNSEVVRAVSDTPAGPYQFEEVVIKPRGNESWDGMMSHNPTIHFHDGKYLLFYTGTNYGGQPHREGSEWDDAAWDTWIDAWHHKRIGLMVADSVYGPWTRPDRPVLESRPGKWDAVLISNAAPSVTSDGTITLLYKSCSLLHPRGRYPGRFNLGAARAANWRSPFQRLSDLPITLSGSLDNHIEDPYIWWNGEGYEMIVKDMTGEVCGEPEAGIHARSRNGDDWEVQNPKKAYSRLVTWEDGTTSRCPKLERPQLLFENGKPTHLFAATMETDADGTPLESWTMVIPLGA